MTSTVKPKAKFSNRNLSAVYKAPSSSVKSTDNAGGFYPPANRMLVLGRSKMSSVAAPAPLNTPSLRKEHYQAPPATGSPARTGWAVPSVAVVTPLRLHDSHSDADTAGSASPARPPQQERPTQSPGEQGNVWASGHVAEMINPELAHHQPEKQPTAGLPETTDGSTASGGRAAGRFARSPLMGSSGRWGDDAVEQDIERRAREKEAQRHREFPDLKEAAQIAAPHHDGHHNDLDGGGSGRAPYPERRGRFDHHERGFHRDDGYSSPYPPYHNDGFDRFDNPRRAWPSRFESQPAVGGGGSAHSHFSPSDARFDGIAARSDVGRALPSFGGGSSSRAGSSRAGSSRAGSSHGSVTSASDLDACHRYPSPPHYSYVPEDEHHHHHEDTEQSPSVPEPSSAPVQPSRPVGHPLPRRDDFRSSSVERQDRYHSELPSSTHDEPMNWRQRPKPSEIQPERSVAARNAPRVVGDVGRVDGAEHERKNSSLSRTSSSSSSVDKPVNTSAGPSGLSVAAQSATASPQVRILKRVDAAPGGPKMLFDPKTGGMVSAEKEEAASMNRRRKQQQQQQQQQQTKVTVEKKQAAEPVSVEVKPTGDVEPATETMVATTSVATLMVGDIELPIHDVPLESSRQSNGDEQPASESTIELEAKNEEPVAVDESPATTVEVSSFELGNDSKKASSRRREVAGDQSSKATTRGKPVARSHERVKAEEHRLRSESTDKKKLKSESRHAAPASPSVALATVPASRAHQEEKRPLKGKRRDDKKNGRQSGRVAVDGAAAKKKERSPCDEATAPKREARSVVMEMRPIRSARSARRSDKREGRGSRREDEFAAANDANKPVESEKSTHSGFQTVKSRRVVLFEKRQMRQQEPVEETKKAAASAETDSSVRPQKQKARKAEQETESEAVSVAAAKSEVAANVGGRNSSGGRRAERQAGGEQASETTPPTRSERPKEHKQRPSKRDNEEQNGSGRKPRGKRGAQTSPEADAAVGLATKPTRAKRKPSEENAAKDASKPSRGDRRARPSATTAEAAAPSELSVSSTSVTSGGNATNSAAKATGKPQRKPSVRKVYVVKATSAPALSAA